MCAQEEKSVAELALRRTQQGWNKSTKEWIRTQSERADLLDGAEAYRVFLRDLQSTLRALRRL